MNMEPIYVLNRHTLDVALNFNYCNPSDFTLYRRKDDRQFRFSRYSGKEYDEFVEFLRNGDDAILIPPAKELRAGCLYTITGKGKFKKVDLHCMPTVLAMNSVMVRHGRYIVMLVNYEVAKYVLANYPGWTFRAMPEMNCQVRRIYDSVASLETIPEDSLLRKYQVFLPIKRTETVDVASIPDEVFQTYLKAEPFTQEYVPFTVGDKVGVRAWGIEEVVPAQYKAVQVTNFSAYLQNEEGLWAEFGLTSKGFRSGFIYKDVKVIPSEGLVTAVLEDKEVVLHSAHSHASHTIASDESGHYGVRFRDQWVIAPEYDWISLWQETGYYEVFKAGSYGLFSPSGACLLSCVYEVIEGFGSQPELFKVCIDQKWGVVGLDDRCYHPLDIPHGDKEALDMAYQEAVLTYLREAYAQHRILPTTVLKTNSLYGYILVELQTSNLRIKVRKEHLPEGLFDQCLYSYWKTAKLLAEMVLFVTDSGQVRFNYEQTQKWKHYKKALKSYTVGKRVCGEVRALASDGYTVRFRDGVFGLLVPTDGKVYALKERVRMQVDRVEGDQLFLSEVIPDGDSESAGLG